MLLLISPFIFVSNCLTYCSAPMLGEYIIVRSSSWILWLLYSVLLCLFSRPLFQSLFYLIWVLLLLLSFGLHLHEIVFSNPSLSVFMCPLFWGGCLVDSIYKGLLVGAFKPFTFKVILMGMVPLPFTLLFWVHIYTTFLCFLSREDPLAFVEELVWWCWILSAFACL